MPQIIQIIKKGLILKLLFYFQNSSPIVTKLVRRIQKNKIKMNIHKTYWESV